MAKITWSEDLSVNISDIDQQHQRLITLFNELDDSMSSGKSKEELSRVLSALIQYTQIHFAAEERLLAAHGFPDLEPHHAEHEKLTVKVLELREKFHAGRIVLTIPVMAFLNEWLIKHISHADMGYSPFLRDKGVY